MSAASTPNKSRGSATAPVDVSRGRSLSVSAIQKAQRGSRRESVLPLCMSRDQHAALHASPVASHSTSNHRKHRGSGACSGKLSQQQIPSAASPLANTATTAANGWSTLLAHTEANQEVARALQMCSLYPTLRVAGTAFENSLNMAHRLSTEFFTLVSSSRRGTELNNGSFSAMHREDVPRSPRISTSVLMETSSALRGATEEWRTSHDSSNGNGVGGGGNGSFHARNSVLVPNSTFAAADAVLRTVALNGGTNMVQMACAMKRAAMWEVVVVTALAHRAMELKFRRERLRRVLERHLLPTLIERRKATGSVLAKKGGAQRGNNNTIMASNSDTASGDGSAAGADSGAAPQGSYLRDHDAFFASLNSSALLQSFAETMTRHRFLPGEVIARAGQLSQRAMYFLISGKCEVTKDRSESGADVVVDLADYAGTNREAAPTPTYRDGMHSTIAPRTRQRGVLGSSVSRCTKEVIMPGATFGGIFGGSAVFAETYRALSQCIVWKLRAEDFEEVFCSFSDRVMLDKYKESMRAHSLAWLQQHYQQAKVFGSIPLYRKIVSRRARYLDDFTPVVKVRGELLFAQDDAPGEVYCLLEGTVLRRTKGSGGAHSDNGVAQRLATNAFSPLHAVGRFLLLGEEPHILPGVQPYSCTVSSRVALFYKITGERFVSALLDDPALYVQLRERLMKQRQSTMVLHPECLAYVPLLQRFPPEKRAELVQYAQPRVVGRSTPLCEPAQHLSELMLVVSGDVCDPRRYGQRPAKSLRVPASSDADNVTGAAGGSGSNNGAGEDGSNNASDYHSFGNTGGAGGAPRPMKVSGLPRNIKGSRADRRQRETGACVVINSSATYESQAVAATDTVSVKRRPAPNTSSNRASAEVKNGGTNFFNDEDCDDDDGGGNDRGGRCSSSAEITGVEWSFSMPEVHLSTAVGSVGNSSNNNSTPFQPANASGEMSGSSRTQRAHLTPSSATAAQQHQKLCQTAAIVYPDESEEINPPLPSQPSRTFLYALGGSWEALLLEKWPNGWETTSTVALWAIPTHKLRLVYNSCTKVAQSYILNGLRLAQKEDQQLPSIPHTKMPPMTVYTQRGEATVVPGAVETSSQSTSRSSIHRRPVKRYADQQQQQRGPAVSPPFAAPTEATSPLYKNGTDGLAGVGVSGLQNEEDPLSGRKKPLRSAKGAVPDPGATKEEATTAASVHGQPSLQSPPRNVSTTSPSPTPSLSKPGHNDNSSVDRLPRSRAEDDSTRSKNGVCSGSKGFLRHKTRNVVASSAPPTLAAIDPAVKAAYDGAFDATDPLMLRIVRDPLVVTPPAAGGWKGGAASGSNNNKPSAKRAAILAGRSLPPLSSGSSGTSATSLTISATTGISSAAWPAQAPVRERWFQAVPSYEPLPGTVRAAETLAAPPIFSLSSTVLALAGIGSSSAHGKTLESHVAYYAATVSPTTADVSKYTGSAGVGLSKALASVSPHPLPKRRAYAA